MRVHAISVDLDDFESFELALVERVSEVGYLTRFSQRVMHALALVESVGSVQ